MGNRYLPIGIQDFEDLRRRGFIYVDKTAFIDKVVREGKPYFLSRPRRFGNSLLLSTMEYYFLGKKELFDGLYISKTEKEWTQYPVIKINKGCNETTRTLEDLKSNRSFDSQFRDGDGNWNDSAWNRSRIWITVSLNDSEEP